MKRLETHIIVVALVFLLGVINLAMAVGYFHRAAKVYQPSDAEEVAGGAEQGYLSIEDIRTLLTQNPLRANAYQLIADRNLFSSQRVAWKAPVEEVLPEGEETISEAIRTDVVLYGTFTLQERMGALLEFTAFPPDQRKATLFPGDRVSSEKDRKGRSYLLQEVTSNYVVLKDQNNIVFKIELYSAKNKTASSTPPELKKTIAVEGGTESIPAASGSPSSVIAGKSRAAEAAETIEKRRAEARQQQVEEGDLRKVSTPFGTVHMKSK